MQLPLLQLALQQVRLTHMQRHQLSLFRAIPARPTFVVSLMSCAAWIDIVSPFMEYKKGQACARLSPVPAVGLHADSLLHATSVQVRSAYRLLCFGQREEPGES